jgi:hypothetical protein
MPEGGLHAQVPGLLRQRETTPDRPPQVIELVEVRLSGETPFQRRI